MKSRLAIVILVVILVVVYYRLGMDYMNQRQEQAELTSQITEVTQAVGEIPQPTQNLEQLLEAAQANLAVEQSLFPTKVNTTRVIDTILRLAAECEVKAIPLVTDPWSIENIGEHSYYVFRLNVAVEGSFSQFIIFVSKLENGKFDTLIVENISVTRLSQQSEEESTEDESVAGETIPIMASLDIAIYTQSLTSD